MSTLVLCVDRLGGLSHGDGADTPLVGQEAVRSLVIDVGTADPENTGVNTLLQGLRVTQDLLESGEEATIAVISGSAESVVTADRAIARQVEELIDAHQPSSAIVILDSPQDEQLLPIIESRIPVDAVDRVVVRQARDIESTYYQMKQFLADEELRQTTLVPIGVALLALPILMTQTSAEAAGATIIAVIGLFLLYKGLGIDAYLASIPAWTKRSLYSGQVSIVTYVVAAGLAVVGVFAGALGVSGLSGEETLLLLAMQFTFDSVPWLAAAALVASMGRLIDRAIQGGFVPGPYLNLPFGVLAVGVVIRGFAGYFLQRGGGLEPIVVPALSMGPLTVDPFSLAPGQRLAVFVLVGILVSVTGVRVATYFGDLETEELDVPDSIER